MNFISPVTGLPLSRDGHSLYGTNERWPVVDDIAFLRADRISLAQSALHYLDAGDPAGATVTLLADQDDWARTPPPDLAARQAVVAKEKSLTFRQAMELLALGPVATYFAHRWSDPTFLSGLALAQAFWSPAPQRAIELACGAGHFLPIFGPNAVGADLVFAKLWLARHFVAPEATLVCFNAALAWPIIQGDFDLLFCHDAFYFLPDKPFVAQQMQRVAPRVLIGHMHNALRANLSAGEPLTPQAFAALFPDCLLFDDTELLNACLDNRVPRPEEPISLKDPPAIALAWPGNPPDVASGALTEIPSGRALQRNPLYQNGRIVWPSERYAREYGGLATYPEYADPPETAISGESCAIDTMARRRILLDLPARW